MVWGKVDGVKGSVELRRVEVSGAEVSVWCEAWRVKVGRNGSDGRVSRTLLGVKRPGRGCLKYPGLGGP